MTVQLGSEALQSVPLADHFSCKDAALIDDWHAVGFSKEVEAGKLVPVRLLGRDLVLWRDSAGTVHVWEDLCIHRGARLSKGWIEKDTVVCPYHGWRYDGTAKCVLIPSAPDETPPAKARAFPHKAVERFGLIWATLGNPQHDVPVFPEWDNKEFRVFHAGPYFFNANGFRSVENFIDATHFPFVHAGLNGVQDNPDRIETYEVFDDPGLGLRTSEIVVFQPYGDHRQVPVEAGYIYRCFRPLVAYFSKRVQIKDPASKHKSNPGDRFCTFLTAQPVDEVSCIIRLAVAINFSPELTEQDILRRQDMVFEQDRLIVETQRPERIPIDLRMELHHRTDRLGQAYRRWLGSLGIHYGTI
ncbi:MAG: aromatic ring-hydroxylating dioxygenase subunit alpha [Afipia sp.]|nr:aromatic ring-hydroxylating dioxygenase subunit alpha [Afipia sp.]